MKVKVNYGDGTDEEELEVTDGSVHFHPFEDGKTHKVKVTVLEEDGVDEAETDETDEDDIFDPADYTVAEVVEYAEANPEQVDDLIAAEEAGKNRSTLISHLESMLPDE